MKFEFFDHTADLGVTVHGSTESELFQNAAAALYHALGEFQLSGERTAEVVTLEGGSNAELLVEFLGELLYRFDVHRRLFDRIEIRELKPGHLSVAMSGATVDWSRSKPNYEIKAVTYHQAAIERAGDGWRARIIFDV